MAETGSIFEPDEAEDACLDAAAMAAYRAGRSVPHVKVAKWLDSWDFLASCLVPSRSRVDHVPQRQ